MVYETADKNSGIWGGKFLERMRHRNDKTDRYYNETDFQLGNTLSLNVYDF